MGFLSAFSSLASSIGSGLSSGSLPLGDWSGGWTNFSSNQSKLKDAYRRQYDYSERYAKESPSWVVEGLRSAGLNPILALQDGSITGASTPNPSLPSGDGSGQFSLGGKSKSERDLINSQITTAKKTADNLEANTDKLHNDVEVAKAHVANETALNNARIENIKQDTLNKANTRGLTGPFSAANQVGQDLDRITNSALDWAKKDIRKTGNNVKSAIDFLKRVVSPTSNSAKDYSKGSERLDTIHGDIEKHKLEIENSRHTPEGRKKYLRWVNQHMGDPAEYWR